MEHPLLDPLKKYPNKCTPYFSEPISAIFVFSDTYDWHADAQVCIDLLCGGDANKVKSQTIPFYQSNENLVFSTDYSKPRLAAGAFTVCVNALYKQFSGEKLKVMTLGKPTKITYNYAEKMLNEINGAPVYLIYKNS